MSETIIINDGTNNFTDYAEITSSIKLFNKQTKRTLRRKVYSNWTGSYKTFGLSFDKIIKLNFDILKLIFESVTSKTFTFRGIAYKIIIIEDTLSFKEEWAPELESYIYTGTLTLEETCEVT